MGVKVLLTSTGDIYSGVEGIFWDLLSCIIVVIENLSSHRQSACLLTAHIGSCRAVYSVDITFIAQKDKNVMVKCKPHDGQKLLYC